MCRSACAIPHCFSCKFPVLEFSRNAAVGIRRSTPHRREDTTVCSVIREEAGMTMIRTTLDWAHLALVATVLCLSSAGQALLLAFHGLFPFPGMLDMLYRRSRPLQRCANLSFNVVLFVVGVVRRDTSTRRRSGVYLRRATLYCTTYYSYEF